MEGQNTSSTPKKTIYLIRHGETDFNRQGIVQGSGVDSELNDTGKEQARLFYQHYRHIPFDKVFVSTLQRTHQTVQHFTESGIDTEILKELNEINWGEMEGRKPDETVMARFQEILGKWREGHLHLPAAGGESPLELFERQQAGLQKILEQEHSTVLICMHGRAMRSFLCLLTGKPLEQMDDWGHTNVCLYVLENNGNNWQVRLENCTRHLNSDGFRPS